MSRYGCSESTASGASVPGQAATSSSHGATSNVLERRRLLPCLLEDLEHRHLASAAQRRARRDRDLGLGVDEPLSDGRRREPGEDRHLDCADVRARVRGDRRLRRHRQVDRDPIAGLDAELDQALGQPRDRVRELGVGQRPAGSVLAPEDRQPGGRSATGARSSRRCSASRRRTRSPTRGRARGRRPAARARRTRARGPRRPPPRTTPARRSSARRAPGRSRTRAGASAGRRSRARASARPGARPPLPRSQPYRC